MTAAIDQVKAIADAVLYEGYLLYPYRASATKNAVRWQWGVLMPPAYAHASDSGERSTTHTELLAEPAAGAALHVRLRFLQVQARAVEVPAGDRFRRVSSVTAGKTEYTTWDEAVERETDFVVAVADLAGDGAELPFVIEGGTDVEPIADGARLIRTRKPLSGRITLRMQPLPGPFGGVVLHLDVRNTSSWHLGGAVREQALPHALIAAHTLLSLSAGRFLSATDPPEWASVATEECRTDGAWPVLVGDPSERNTVLCSPIILYDFPAIAEQSAGELYDGTEIDEILTLRTMTLTDEEKREARATDPRAAELIDRVDHLPPELIERLHGTVHYLRTVTGESEKPQAPWWDPGADASVSPETDSVLVAGVPVSKGSRVRLRPGHRADAHDMFLDGRIAVVQAVLLDVDDEWHLAVTLEDDLGSDLYAAHGRYRYFSPDEIEPLP